MTRLRRPHQWPRFAVSPDGHVVRRQHERLGWIDAAILTRDDGTAFVREGDEDEAEVAVGALVMSAWYGDEQCPRGGANDPPQPASRAVLRDEILAGLACPRPRREPGLRGVQGQARRCGGSHRASRAGRAGHARQPPNPVPTVRREKTGGERRRLRPARRAARRPGPPARRTRAIRELKSADIPL